MAVHTLAHARLAVPGDEPRDIVLRDEIVEVVVRLQRHVAAAPAVAAAGPALGDVGLAMEGDAALAAVPRLRVNFYLVDEHADSSNCPHGSSTFAAPLVNDGFGKSV